MMTRNIRIVVYTIANSILRPPVYLTNIIIVTFLFRIKQEKLLFLKYLYKNNDICRFLFPIILKNFFIGASYYHFEFRTSVFRNTVYIFCFFNAQSGIGHSFSQKGVFNPSSTHPSQLIIEVVI